MTCGALIMAGGAGERMRDAAAAKPLVRIRGASLLERNTWALLGAAIPEIWIACRAEQRAIRDEIERLGAAARRRGVAIEPLLETMPLGTIGAAGRLRGRADTVVTVNADNLTALDLGVLLAHHATVGADLTLATHDHSARLPYGAIETEGDRVTAYREKPVSVRRIASAVCVLGSRALAVLDGPMGLPALATRMIADGMRVTAHQHAAPWIDINEPGDIARAAALVAAHAGAFECWAPRPDAEVAGAILRDPERILLELRRDSRLWDTPGGKLEPGETAVAALERELTEELGIAVTAGAEVARFDTLEPDGRALRHHVFAPAFDRTTVRPREGQSIEWFALDRLPPDRSPVVERSLAGLA